MDAILRRKAVDRVRWKKGGEKKKKGGRPRAKIGKGRIRTKKANTDPLLNGGQGTPVHAQRGQSFFKKKRNENFASQTGRESWTPLCKSKPPKKGT